MRARVRACLALAFQGLESMDDLAAVLEEGMRQKSLEHFKHLQDCPALVLNADFQPLSFVPLSLVSLG